MKVNSSRMYDIGPLRPYMQFKLYRGTGRGGYCIPSLFAKLKTSEQAEKKASMTIRKVYESF